MHNLLSKLIRYYIPFLIISFLFSYVFVSFLFSEEPNSKISEKKEVNISQTVKKPSIQNIPASMIFLNPETGERIIPNLQDNINLNSQPQPNQSMVINDEDDRIKTRIKPFSEYHSVGVVKTKNGLIENCNKEN